MFAVVQQLQLSTGGCILCGSQNAPYLVAGIMTPLVATAEGPKRIRGEMAFCIGTPDHPGCLDTALGEAGGLGPHAHKALQNETAKAVRQYEQHVTRLQEELEDALANVSPVVSLDDARTLLGREVA